MSTNSAPDMSYVILGKNFYEVKVTRLGIRIRFSLIEYGSMDAAKKAAIKYRDGLYDRYRLLPLRNGSAVRYVKSRVYDDVVSGVYLYIEKKLSSGYFPIAYFIVNRKTPDGWKKKRFSIAKLGYIKAFREALKVRLESGDIEVFVDTAMPPAPTMKQFMLLVRIANDVRLPKEWKANSRDF